eukprot:CAMPEP_0196999556 /NCGR_PEP_ID=MMETSP1380-20130617/4701_1 /TAXON_ID=5936 /ORGANISM="Euplotes crassus, Strain CT5" /LENGTH=629 /DNA_ID=CAMNT_0042416519 /DNA_START=17 /DNA_END=1906 /DNA_ORIENTATION=+
MFTRRVLQFKKPAVGLGRTFSTRSTFANIRAGAFMRSSRRVLPALGFSLGAFYGMKHLNYSSKFRFSTQMAEAQEEFKEIEVTGHENLGEGEMMAFQVGPKDGDKILIAKYQGKIYALSNFCSHFGVPLAGSVLLEDKVICPAHNAAFSIVDGYPEYAPALNGLPTYETYEKDGKLFVKLPPNYKASKQVDMATRDESNKARVVIVGGGAAGLSAAETLRQSDYTGEIIILSDEDKTAYDRTLLSKVLVNGDADKWLLRKQDFFDKYGIDFRTSSKVKGVNVESNEVTLADGTTVSYDKLLLATGGHPKRPILPGIDLEGVYTLRNASDQEKIKSHVKDGLKVVIAGASFIGFEAAASFASSKIEGVQVHVVDMVNTAFEGALGKDVGGVLQKLGEDNGVKFHLSNGVKKIHGEGGKATKVELNNGEILDADIVLFGTGVQPTTQYIQEGIELDRDGSIKVNPFLQTSASNVYAAGDIASYPYHVTGARARVEHWNHALQQGEIAAFNILGKDIPYDAIPFFWTRNYMKSLQYVGYTRDYDDVFVDGSLEEQKFVAYYTKGEKIQAAAAFNRGADIHIIKEAMRLGLLPKASEIKDGSVTVQDLKAKILAKPGASACRRKSCCRNKKSS